MIRDSTPADLEQIVDIYNASIPGRLATADLAPVSVDSRREWFEGHDSARHPLWVYDEGEGIIGWLSLSTFYPRTAWKATAEISVYVSPDHQKRGVAAVMVNEAISQAPALGLSAIVALIFGHNQPSLSLFRRFGFDDWGTMPEVCDLDGLIADVLILGRHVA